MHDDDTESLIYLGAGPLAAILLGMCLVPLRTYTTASNFTFAFIALIILVAEYGGGRAALATALCSALSLDFFLTQPYLRLTIEDKHDVIAFFGLAACGLVAASLSSQRGKKAAALRSAHEQLDLIHIAIEDLQSAEPFDFRIVRLLDAVRAACPISAVGVRDVQDAIVAASGQGIEATRIPTQIVSLQTLLPRGADADGLLLQNPPIPPEGVRLALVSGNRQFGWLDLWGDGTPASARSRRTLAGIAYLIALQLAGGVGRRTAHD
jgi:hypothetical protein